LDGYMEPSVAKASLNGKIFQKDIVVKVGVHSPIC